MRTIILIMLGILATTVVKAQQEGIFNLNLQGGLPTNEFRQASSNFFGFGIGGSLLGKARRNGPFYVGVDASYMIYGRETTRETIILDGFDQDVNLVRNNNLFSGHLVLRLAPGTGHSLINPYVEGLVGARYFYTRSKLKESFMDEPLESNTELSSWTFSYGFGGGVNIRLVQSIYADVRLVYLNGGRARYLEKGSVYYDQPSEQLKYDIKRSTTDMFIPTLGVSYRF